MIVTSLQLPASPPVETKGKPMRLVIGQQYRPLVFFPCLVAYDVPRTMEFVFYYTGNRNYNTGVC